MKSVCQEYQSSKTSICLRPYLVTYSSLERGSIDLCEHHHKRQIDRDYRLNWRRIRTERAIVYREITS
jgi:hypothetical protein